MANSLAPSIFIEFHPGKNRKSNAFACAAFAMTQILPQLRSLSQFIRDVHLYFYRQQPNTHKYFSKARNEKSKKEKTFAKSFCHLEFFFTVDLFHHHTGKIREMHVKYEMGKKRTVC